MTLPDDAPFKELIRAKRDGARLSGVQLRRLAQGITDGGLSDVTTFSGGPPLRSPSTMRPNRQPQIAHALP